jgi:RHS repeat-associated protein
LTLFNGTTVEFTYDDAHRLTALENKKSGTVIAGYRFTLDGNGNRTGVVRNELINHPAAAAQDASYTYNSQRNRLLQAGSNSFSYDDEGQLAGGYGLGYSFDYEHRLTGVGASTRFIYDGRGNRVQATRNGVVTRYIYDAAGNLIAEADGANNITRYYIYGQGLLAMATPANQVYCYHFNATGSTVAVSDSGGSIVSSYAYDAFGNITGQQEAAGLTQPFKYVGQYGVMSEPNGFYYMRARYYDPKVGRFISEDPIGFDAGDVNLYAYVGNNPVMSIDPNGLWDARVHGRSGTQFVDDDPETAWWNPAGFKYHFSDTQTALAGMSNATNQTEYNRWLHAWEDSYNPAHASVLTHIGAWVKYVFSGFNPDYNPDYQYGINYEHYQTMEAARSGLPTWEEIKSNRCYSCSK